MTAMIVLSAAEADQVRGSDSPGAALVPIALVDGRYILPVAVLTDPPHAQHWAFLAGMPRQDLAQLLNLLPPAPEE